MGSFLSSQSQLPPACSSAAPSAAASPEWTMLLAPYAGGYGEACNVTGDSKTIAAASTSSGHRISVSLHRDPSSVLSRICLSFLPGAANRPAAYSTVIAAHGDSLLLQITSTESKSRLPNAFDYFVYTNAGAAPSTAAADDDPTRPPPSLYLIPPYDDFFTSKQRWPSLDISATGLLMNHHGNEAEDEFVVAQLKTTWVKGDATPKKEVELLLFRHGEWCVKRRRIIHDHGKDGDRFLASWEPEAVVPLGAGGGRLLCWVDSVYGVIIFSDVLGKGGPGELRYVPYPAAALMYYQRFLCTDARGAVKLVTAAPRRCSHCGAHATAIDTWTLKTDDLAWVLETETDKAAVDSAELWMLPLHRRGYARQHLVVYPVAASMNGGGGHGVASMNGGGDAVSYQSAAPMEEDPSVMASLHDRLQGGNRVTKASTGDYQQRGDNGPATVDRWPKRRRRANSMVTGPEWTV